MTSPRCSRSASPFLPVILSAWVMTLSRPSYSFNQRAAKPGPTPGTPGRLSDVSPTIAARSGYRAGGTPYLASTASGVIRASSDTPRIG